MDGLGDLSYPSSKKIDTILFHNVHRMRMQTIVKLGKPDINGFLLNVSVSRSQNLVFNVGFYYTAFIIPRSVVCSLVSWIVCSTLILIIDQVWSKSWLWQDSKIEIIQFYG